MVRLRIALVCLIAAFCGSGGGNTGDDAETRAGWAAGLQGNAFHIRQLRDAADLGGAAARVAAVQQLQVP